MNSVDITNYVPFLAVLFGGGVGVTLVAQLLKKLFKADEAHVIHLLVVAVSVIAAGAQYVIQFKGKLPTDVLGVSTPVIYGVSQFVYKESGYANKFLARLYSQPQVATTTTPPVSTVGSSGTAVTFSATNQLEHQESQEPSVELSV